jgi:hypothetical protein
MTDNAADNANANLDNEVIDNEVIDEQHQDANADAGTTDTPKKDEQVDNAEASRIGRIVKKQLEKETGTLKAEIERLNTTIAALKPPKTQQDADIALPPCPVEGIPTTPEEHRMVAKWVRQCDAIEASAATESYTKGYISSINSLKEEGGELHAQIQELLTKDGSPYNRTQGTGRGDIDAALNYRMAHRDILANKVKTGGNPFKGKKDDVATGVSASSRVPASKTIAKAFDDPKAEEFAKYLGYTDEDRAKVLTGNR